MVIH
jgi:hypothetical protein